MSVAVIVLDLCYICLISRWVGSGVWRSDQIWPRFFFCAVRCVVHRPALRSISSEKGQHDRGAFAQFGNWVKDFISGVLSHALRFYCPWFYGIIFIYAAGTFISSNILLVHHEYSKSFLFICIYKCLWCNIFPTQCFSFDYCKVCSLFAYNISFLPSIGK